MAIRRLANISLVCMYRTGPSCRVSPRFLTGSVVTVKSILVREVTGFIPTYLGEHSIMQSDGGLGRKGAE